MDSFALQHPHDQGHNQNLKIYTQYIHIYIDIQYSMKCIFSHMYHDISIYTQYRMHLLYINMLKLHRIPIAPGGVFSKIQELFSFQQDVAATKKNPMCWLRRAEAPTKHRKIIENMT